MYVVYLIISFVNLVIYYTNNIYRLFYSEVCKALNKNRGLYGRWTELQDVVVTSSTVSGGIPISRDELEWTTTELRKALRSIEWDLDDLEDTIYILFYIYP